MPSRSTATRRYGRGRPPLDDDVSGLHEEDAQVLVATLGNLAELGAIARRHLLSEEAEPNAAVEANEVEGVLADVEADRRNRIG